MISLVRRYFSTRLTSIRSLNEVQSLKVPKLITEEVDSLITKTHWIQGKWPKSSGGDPSKQVIEVNYIQRKYTFKYFEETCAFFNKAGLVADMMDHHPEWTLKEGEVQVLLSTHDVGGVSAKDLWLARAMDLIEEKVKQGKIKHIMDDSFVSEKEILGVVNKT